VATEDRLGRRRETVENVEERLTSYERAESNNGDRKAEDARATLRFSCS